MAENGVPIVFNDCYGGFGLSETALDRWAELAGVDRPRTGFGIERHNKHLVQVVEQMGDRANAANAKLAFAYVPLSSRYRIEEFDGKETVKTVADYDWKIAEP